MVVQCNMHSYTFGLYRMCGCYLVRLALAVTKLLTKGERKRIVVSLVIIHQMARLSPQSQITLM